MGIEYRLQAKSASPLRLDALLRSGPFFTDFNAEYSIYNFRLKPTDHRNEMPDIAASVELDGLYLCAYGRSDVAKEVIEFLKTSLENEFGEASIEEL